MKIRTLFLTLCALAITIGAMAQDVVWSSSYKHISGQEYEVLYEAKIPQKWHMYDMTKYVNGPVPTSFVFEPATNVQFIGDVKANAKATKVFDETFEMEIGYYEGTVVFSRKFKLLADKAQIKVTVESMICNNTGCMPPTDAVMSVDVKSAAPIAKTEATQAVDPMRPTAATETTPSIAQDSITKGDTIAATLLVPATKIESSEPSTESKSIWALVIEAILWGFAALLTPCVFPMVPMTVSFFMKNSGSAARGRFMAAIYGLFIIGLYTLPIAAIILITRVVGGDAITADIFNWLATHWIPNVIFFAVFMLFAASFFGAFEITIPSWMVNKSDSKADKGGLGGVFFMALTLVLVSFSCTGPIVGSVLIKSTAGEFWEPIITMLAFSTAFALPFILFAFFPSLLKDLPKSGGWLNSVKVVLGFIEVALGLKFLSVADQTYHWGLLDREVYLAIWIVVFALLGLYLLGKLKFAHDSEVKHITVTRLLLSIATFSFVVYMIPGMFGAPLKALSGYLPPMHTQDFRLNSDSGVATSGTANTSTFPKAKYSDFLHLPHDLNGFFDYNEAFEYAQKVGKPLFVDFTGHGCVNCREMEAKVWSDPTVLNILKNDYVIVALYSDDKKEVPESDWVTMPNGTVLKGLGKINSYFARTKFGANAQPYYVILDRNGETIATRGYNLNVDEYIAFLRNGVEKYKQNL